MTTRLRWLLSIAAAAALGLVTAQLALSAEDGRKPDRPKPPPKHEEAQPPERPRGEADRPREREGRPEAEGRRPQGPPRDREGRPGPEGRRPEGPPREPEGDRPHRHGPEMPIDADRPIRGKSFAGGVSPMGPGMHGPQGPQMHPPVGPMGRPMMPGMMPGQHADFEAMRHRDPEMFRLIQEDNELDRRTRELGMQFRQAPPEQRERIQKEVNELVNKQFEIRQQRRMMELKRLEEEIHRVREATERRAKAREQIIQRRVSELLGREDDLGF